MYLLVCLVVAGITHIGAIFALPRLARSDIFSLLDAEAPTNALALVDRRALASWPFVDPAVAIAVCRYDLSDGPVRLRVPLSETFLTIAFAQARRGIFASVSDRAATGGLLDVVLATEAQLARISQLDEPDQAIEEIRIVSPNSAGLAILKVFIDRPSGRDRAEAVLTRAQCESEALPG